MLNRWEEECLEYSDNTLTDPPKWEWAKRVQGVGDLVQRFVLPLDLCLTSNVRMRAGVAGAGWKLGKVKQEVSRRMLIQAGRRFRVPLGGRPQILAIRYTSRPTDATSDWAKVPIDRLLPSGLGLIADDSPKHVDISTWCEPKPTGKPGFVVLEVWSGEAPKPPKKRRRKS